jgi:phosphatidylinositol alpha-mannosyltransferase
VSSHAVSRTRARRWVASAVTLAVLAGLIVLAAVRIDPARVGGKLAHIRGGWVAAGVALMVAAFLSRAESWFAAVRAALPDQPVGRPVVTRALLIGMAGSAVAPGRVGEAARAWVIARHYGGAKQTLGTAIGTLVSQTLLNILALTILAAVALSGSALPGAHVGAIGVALALPIILVTVLVAGPKLLDSLAERGRGRVRRWLGRARDLLAEIRRGIRVFGRPGTALHSSSFQLGAWGLQLGSCYAVILAFGLQDRASIAAAAAVLVAVNITAVLPLTPSNVGVFQAACIAVLAPFGVHAAEGLAYGLVLQATEVVSAVALGVPSMLHEGVRLGALRSRPDRETRSPAREHA